jgi:hypothetical protein
LRHHNALKAMVLKFEIWQRHGMNSLLQNRLLLCRAQGGLNDVFSEIGRCLRYARTYHRQVIVETDYFDLNHFNDCFAHYFISHAPDLILDAAPYRAQFDHVSSFPQFIQGRVTRYRTDQDTVGIDLETHKAVVVDFSRDHDAQLLVHHSNAQQKGRNALLSLNVLQLQPHLIQQLDERIRQIGTIYDAIHIRHTDYKTNFEAKVQALRSKIQGHVFVATDNRDVLLRCKDILGDDRVFSFTELPSDAGVPLHHKRGLENARERNESAILDLFTLAKAQTYYFFPRQTQSFALRPSYSGFSVLVDRLRHEPRLLHKVLTGIDDGSLKQGSQFGARLRQWLGR